jgi:hypothetical protein
MTDHIANAEAAPAAFKQAISVDGEIAARPPARMARAREGERSEAETNLANSAL